jgi:hypothetical protein
MIGAKRAGVIGMDARGFGNQLLLSLVRQAQGTVPDCLGLGVSIVTLDGPHSVAATGAAERLDPLQWQSGQGFLVEALRSEGSLLAGPDEFAGRAGLVGDALADEGVHGCVVSAGTWTEQAPCLVVAYLSTAATPDHAGALDRFEPLLAMAAAMVEYCAGEELRSEQLVEMTRYRRVIEQAKGALAARTAEGPEQAFETLSRASQDENVRLRDLAVAVVEQLTDAAPVTEMGAPAHSGQRAYEVAARLLAARDAGSLDGKV